MTSTYLGYASFANNLPATLQRYATQPATARETAYYQANIGKVTSVSQFVNNYRLFTYAMKAFGLTDMGNAKAFMTKVLESDLTSSTSFANKLSDSRYKDFAAAFQFSTKGAAMTTATAAQSTAQSADTTALFAKNAAAASVDDTSAQAATTYFTETIGSVKTVAALEGDSQLMSYVRTAYGLDDTISTAQITAALEGKTNASTSASANGGTTGLSALAADFNFDSTGAATVAPVLQSTAAITATTASYTAAAGTGAAAKAEAAYYTSVMPSIGSLDAFLADSRLTSVAKKAYGLPATTTTAQLRAYLTSDPANVKSAAAKAGTAAQSFAAAFNVTSTGALAAPAAVAAQSRSGIETLRQAYVEQTMETDSANVGDGVQLALYFRQQAASLTSPYQILADKALTKVVQTMFGLAASTTEGGLDAEAASIKSKLNFADLKDPAKVNKLIARFSALYDMNNSSNDSSSTISLLF